MFVPQRTVTGRGCLLSVVRCLLSVIAIALDAKSFRQAVEAFCTAPLAQGTLPLRSMFNVQRSTFVFPSIACLARS